MDEFDSSQYVELMPFIHQVGGHSFMLSLDEATVCKTLIPRELQFYQTLPPSVRKFTPAFHGVIGVITMHDQNGYIRFLCRPPGNYHPQGPAKARVRFKKSGSIELISTEGVFAEDTTASPGSALNPWALICHKQHMDQWKLDYVKQDENKFMQGKSTEEQDFILLENLVWRYRYPCILDLKMGTRQYSDAASLAKKQSKMVKVVSTTSAKLGLRLGGMQVYQTSNKKFLCRNKFYGRTLSVAGFQQALVQFLHNGVRFRSDVLSALIRKLEELGAVLTRLEAIRFYTTSLLLLYEGEDKSDVEAVDIPSQRLSKPDAPLGGRRGSDGDLGRRVIPAASVTCFQQSPQHGNQSKRRTSSAANLDSSIKSGASSNSSSSSTIFDDCINRKPRPENFRGRSFSTKSDPGGGLRVPEPRVDVRMIDFAHSTHKELDDVVVYAGPDKGFIFGIETLISMLKSIETDYG